jgi:anti-sigma factor RsiW
MSTPNCEAIGEELVAFLDDELDEATRRPVASHVATCLVCRREVERLTLVRRWVSELPAVEPSPSLADGLWAKIAAEATPSTPAPNVRVLRPWRWAAPALAAAAVVALAFSSLFRTTESPRKAPSAASERLAAPGPAVQPDAPVVVARPAAPKDEPSNEEAPQVAAADAARPEDLRPEDLPPKLLDNPELFLRLPVVRRLETLEHIDAVQNSHDDGDGGAG